MKIYLDNCTFNRPFDDQSSIRVKLEAEAKLSGRLLGWEGRCSIQALGIHVQLSWRRYRRPARDFHHHIHTGSLFSGNFETPVVACGDRFPIGKCEKINVDHNITNLALQIKEYGDDRTHSNLERKNPRMANLGGESRVVEILTPSKHLIHPYKGDAKQAILATRDLLNYVFG